MLKALDVQIRKFSGFLVSFEIENKRTIWLLVKASLMFMIMVLLYHVHDHGKVVSGFFRLKCHLGGICGDVTPCENAPQNMKELFRNKLLERKIESLSMEVDELNYPNLPRKRNCCQQLKLLVLVMWRWDCLEGNSTDCACFMFNQSG